MGRGRQATASPEEHEEISRLNTKLQAYRARTSHVQTRLLTTLDTLDTLQASFDAERKNMETELRRLELQLDECTSSVKRVQAEKDDLQDAVLRLVEKIESQDGPWPRSQMLLSSFAEPLPPRKFKPAHTDEEVLSFAASIIKTLRIERDFERDAHERTKEEYETRILMLEARIARLEAELEICIQEHTAPRHVETSPTPMRVSPRRSDEPITDDEAIEMLNSTVARNKALEMEIKTLVSRLEHARSGYADTGVNTSPPPYQPDTMVEVNASPSPPPPNLPHSDSTADVPAESDNSTSHSARSSDRSVSSTAIREEHGVDEPTVRSTSPHVHENRQGSCDDTISVPVSAISPKPYSPKNELRELGNQINEFAAQVDAFTYERDELKKVISSAKEELDDQCSPVSIEVPERLKIVEMECSRLRDSEEILRSDIEALQRSAQVREEYLLGEIQTLKEQISALAQQTKEALQNPNDEVDLLGDEGSGERSMELETPLQPTSLLQDISQSPPHSPAHDGALTAHRHPPSISLPPTPIIYPERTYDPIVHRLSHSTPALETTEPPYAPSDASDANIERLAMELSVAHRRVQEGEDALNDLQTILEDFQSAHG